MTKIPEAVLDAPVEVEEVRALKRAALAAVDEAEGRWVVARDRIAREGPVARAVVEYRRAVEGLKESVRDIALVGAIWDMGARLEETESIRHDRCERRIDGSTVYEVLGKGALGSGKRVRPVAVTDETAMWIERYSELVYGEPRPASGYVWPGAITGRPVSASTIERRVHRLAVQAGLQRVRPNSREKPTHRYKITPKGIRQTSEIHAITTGREDEEKVAGVHGHSRATQRRSYLRATVQAAVDVANARRL